MKRSRSKMRRFASIEHIILNSESWKDLSNTAVRLYIELLRRYNGGNNGHISLSCREAARVCHSSKGTAGKKFKELQEHGFITISSKGHFSYHDATTWRLTVYKTENKLPTHDWQNWRKPEKIPLQKTEKSTPDNTPSTPDISDNGKIIYLSAAVKPVIK